MRGHRAVCCVYSANRRGSENVSIFSGERYDFPRLASLTRGELTYDFTKPCLGLLLSTENDTFLFYIYFTYNMGSDGRGYGWVHHLMMGIGAVGLFLIGVGVFYDL